MKRRQIIVRKGGADAAARQPGSADTMRPQLSKDANMSQLSLYRPPVTVEDDEPQILSYVQFTGRVRANRMLDVITRARVEKQNRHCPCCHRVTVQPLELGDAVRNRNGAKVPGTATIVGFRCRGCRHEWPVLDRA